MNNSLTPVERAALARSPFRDIYPPTERIRCIVVENFPALGKLAALRFLEWVQDNPEGVVSLPTGKTPEHFIRWTDRALRGWQEAEVRAMLEDGGLDLSRRPDMRGLRLVQADEFYPIHPSQQNSFRAFVERYYLEGFGMDADRALLIDNARIGLAPGDSLESVWPGDTVDLSLRYRMAEDALERKQKDTIARIDEWCQNYEDRVREMGGIGFFLGGIGPDGHIGFNVRGSDHHSTARLTDVNFATQANAATDLGGIEVARKRKVITIGLGTLAFNPKCVALVIAAGETRSGVVANAVQKETSILYPATALHKLPNARFYVTRGAAQGLGERRLASVAQRKAVSGEEGERAAIDLATRLGKRLADLTEDDFDRFPLSRTILERRPETARGLALAARDRIIERIERGSTQRTRTRFFHTEPHHDDIMLGYLPYAVRHVRDSSNVHYFYTMTSGFTAVTNRHLSEQAEGVRRFLDTPNCLSLLEEGYFEPGDIERRNRDVWQYLDGVAAESPAMREEGAARRMLRDLIEIHGERGADQLKARAAEIKRYLKSQYPGSKDPAPIQRLKGMRREWEAECLWGYFGWECSHVRHLRLGFYTGNIFTEAPSVERDVLPILEELKRVNPDVVTVAIDPEGSGPDTHYKAMQAISEALRRYEEATGRADIRVVGYRNVWHRFHPSEATVYVPISLNMFSVMSSAFMNTFISQKDASFPSPEHDGPFSELAQRIQVEQYQTLKTCLGREWFHEHPSPLIRGTRGFVFLREMSPGEFYEHTRERKQAAESV